MIRTITMSMLALTLAACAGAPPDAPEPETPEVNDEGTAEAEVPAKAKEAAELAKALKAADDPAEELQSRGMSQAQLDAMMFEIASDPELSKAYSSLMAN